MQEFRGPGGSPGQTGDASKKIIDKHLKKIYHGSHQQMIGIRTKFAWRVWGLDSSHQKMIGITKKFACRV